jgi:hypothetical protein
MAYGNMGIRRLFVGYVGWDRGVLGGLGKWRGIIPPYEKTGISDPGIARKNHLRIAQTKHSRYCVA